MVDRSTTFFREQDVMQKWYVVDANGKTLGRGVYDPVIRIDILPMITAH